MTKGLIPGGFLIAIEGIDGSGKSTLARMLAEQLRARDIAVSMSKEPTAGPWGARLRASASEGRLSHDDEMEFLLADRRQHVEEVIKPALKNDEIVILDRYYPSMAAYQGATGGSVSEILLLNAFAPTPDLTLILDLSPEVGLSRIRARGDVPNHFETEENLEKCRSVFLSMKLPSRAVIDAGQDISTVHSHAWREIIRAAASKLTTKDGATVDAGNRLVKLSEASEAVTFSS